MADPTAGAASPEPAEEPSTAAASGGCATRKEKRKALKKLKRKQTRREAAIREREEEGARLGDPEDHLRIRLREQEEADIAERERKLFEERERLWLEAAAARKAAEEKEEEERRKKLLEESQEEKNHHDVHANELDEDDEWEYIEEGPAEIIWQGNEIIVKKKRVRVAKRTANRKHSEEDDDRPTSNPLPPQSVAFASYMNSSSVSAKEVLERVAQEVPNFGTEQDKAHCPFHLKTGACRFGSRCSRVHFRPDKSCTLLIKNMYNGPGLAWEQDEGLEYTDEEVERCYEEFYEDVHTEFLKFGELVNFKVCKNGSYHLRGNVYVHYKSLDSAVLAYNNINGRYFAGKQITCEFISVTRWKVAICGEYMKSKLKTCSHGSACNFIHCFRNPGGDYEWADWDNPPPKHWIRKMVALFGPSNEYEYDKQVEFKEFERSNRKRTPSNRRYHSRRTDSSSSPTKDSELVRGQCNGRSVRRGHSSRRKEKPVSVEKHERSEEYAKSGSRYQMHSYDSSEDIYEDKDRDFLKKHQKYEENCYDDQEKSKRKHKEDLLRRKRGKSYSNEHMKSKNYKSRSHERQEYVHSSDYIDDDRELSDGHSNSLSSDKSSHRLSIDEERYNGRSCSDDLGSNVDSCVITSQHSAWPTERREYDQYNSRHHSNHKSYDYEVSGHNSKFGKEKDDNHRVSSHDSDWKVRSEGSDLENVHDHLPRSSSSQKKHDKSSRKRKLHQEKGENKDSSDEFGDLEAGNKELNGRKDARYSRRHSGSLRRKIDQTSSYDS